MNNSRNIVLYKQEARRYLSCMEDAKNMLSHHKQSIGVVGEQLLMQSIRQLLSINHNICQGFIFKTSNSGQLLKSRQCDIIIYRKNRDAIYRDYDNVKIINSEYVDAVIEVKSSIQRKTFGETLKSFEQLDKLGILRKYLFIYGKTSLKSLSNYLFSVNLKNELENIYSSGAGAMDFDCLGKLPQVILSLGAESFYSLENYTFHNGDGIGYLSHKIKDVHNKRVCSLALFFEYILHQVNGDFKIDISELSYDKGIALCYY